MSVGKLHLILLAGGQGTRAAAADNVPKQFRATGRGLLFAVSLREFLTLDQGEVARPVDLILTVPDPWRQTASQTLQELDIPWGLAAAGTTRTGSTWNALRELETRFQPQAEDLVAVHDAARPFATADLLTRLVRAAAAPGGAVPGIPVSDTIIRTDRGEAEYLERPSLMAVQTPQVFLWDLFQAAHTWAAASGKDHTDVGSLLASRGHLPRVVPGEQNNWKVTTNGDWSRATALLDSPI